MMIRACAKINLTLDITGKRPDGYHDIETVMQSVSLCDEIRLEKSTSEGITLRCSKPFIPTDGRNVAYKAAESFFSYTGLANPGIYIKIYKRIPVTAGLAGGSTDAAGVLAGLNEMFQTELTLDELCGLALPIGADVPFCLRGGTMLGKGVGEKLTPLPTLPDCTLLLIKPTVNVSTKTAYQRYSEQPLTRRPDTAAMVRALEEQSLSAVAQNMCNVFEELVPVEQVRKIKEELTERGAIGVQMSGSGPTTVGVFENKDRAKAAALELFEKYKEVHVCTPVLIPIQIWE